MSESTCPTCHQLNSVVQGLIGPDGVKLMFCDRPLCFQVAVLEAQVSALEETLRLVCGALEVTR